MMKKPRKEELKVVELYSREEIQDVVQVLAKEISEDYVPLLQKDNCQLVLVGILNGAVPFIGDLAREISQYFPLGMIQIDYLAISSYKGRKQKAQIRIEKDTKTPLKGKHILVIEDIVDSGRTLRQIVSIISAKEPASIKVCTLINRHKLQRREVEPDYVGLTFCKDSWLIGYGLDLDGFGRELPFIGYIVDP